MRLGAFCNHSLSILQKQGIKAPVDKVALTLLFIITSYIPALIFTMLFVKKEPPRFDPSMHVFNRPDAMEMSKITQMVAKLQENVAKLSLNGDADGNTSASAQQDRQIVKQTQE